MKLCLSFKRCGLVLRYSTALRMTTFVLTRSVQDSVQRTDHCFPVFPFSCTTDKHSTSQQYALKRGRRKLLNFQLCWQLIRFSFTMWIYAFLTGLDFKGMLLFICVALLIFDYLKYKNASNYPPGPLALPFVGSMFSIDMEKPHVSLTKVSQGNAYTLYIHSIHIKGHMTCCFYKT